MSVNLNSYLMFDGDAKAAIDFYHSIFGGEVLADTYGDFADKMPFEDNQKDKIMHAQLKGDHGIELMASDIPHGEMPTNTSRITLTLSGDDAAILQGYWNGLSAGGTVTMPLAPVPWGDSFGTLTDKYGIEWMFNISQPTGGSI